MDTGKRTVVKRETAASRRGVAVILVVGLLSVLMLAAVAFSISMRIERRGAANLRHSVRAKHVLNSALALAIEDINSDLDGSGGLLVYPDWAVISTLPQTNQPASCPARVLSREALGFVPGSLTNAVKSAEPYWRAVTNSEGDVWGRYAYVVVNCSGLLDANRVGGTNRLYGSSPREMFGSESNSCFVVRDNDIRYETLSEFINLNGAMYDLSPGDFALYSRFPCGRLEGVTTVTNTVYIGGDEAELLSKKDDIVQALKDSGINDAYASFVFTNLIDYVDGDCEPEDLASPCTEAVPMINEVKIEGNVRTASDGTTCSVRTRARIEVFYPFVDASTNAFSVNSELETLVTNVTAGSSVANILKDGPTSSDTESYLTLLGPQDAVSIAASPNDMLMITVRVRANVVIQGSGIMVDAVPYPTNGPPLSFVQTVVAPIPDGSAGLDIPSLECTDPRFNWDCSRWQSCTNGDGTLTDENTLTTKYINRGKGDPRRGYDFDTAMYVSDRGHLVSVGELGNLVRGPGSDSRFRTIRLFDHDVTTNSRLDDVLGHFTVQSDSVRRGLVNLNTTNAYALDAVFYDMSLGYYAGAQRITDPDVRTLVDAIVYTSLDAGDAFTNVSEIGSLDTNWRDLFTGWTDLEREAAIGNSYQLLGTRHNLFTVIIRAEAYSPAMGGGSALGTTLASTHAVAEVWRDPFRDESITDADIHRWFVRLFKVLED